MPVNEVRECLSNLDISKACGPDGIPARLLKECSEQIAPSLCLLFSFSLSWGKLPYEWKTADITPLHKKDSKEPAENYRPISLLTIISKILERCVATHFCDHVTHLISLSQHGFLKNRSCVTQLLSVLHAIGEALDKNIQSDLIYLDFAKAFDSVDHSILLAKLKAYGVSGPLFSWFTDYLTGHAQRVVVEGAASKWALVTSGVPQGSLLGPLLFTIFINDLPEEVVGGVRVALYADDTKLYKSVTSICDCQSLQTTLGNLNRWSKHNRIKFNTSKCKSLTVTRKKSPLVHEYTLDSAQLERVSTEKDLAVHITSSLSWKPHIHAITTKANKLLGLLKRTCPLITDVTVRRTLYLSLVKSQLCYVTQVWSPAQVTLKAQVERVQRRATRWILQTRVGEVSYKDRLTKLDLLPLSYDRELKDLLFFYKCLYNYIDLNVHCFVDFISHGRTRLSNSLNLKTPICRTSTFQASYFNRIVKLWNFTCSVLPSTSFDNPGSFRESVRNVMLARLKTTYDIDWPCTWTLASSCSCH